MGTRKAAGNPVYFFSRWEYMMCCSSKYFIMYCPWALGPPSPPNSPLLLLAVSTLYTHYSCNFSCGRITGSFSNQLEANVPWMFHMGESVSILLFPSLSHPKCVLQKDLSIAEYECSGMSNTNCS